MDRAHAEGVNFFDTANVYGFDAGKGRTEEVLGTWFAQGGERRERTVLATKVYGSMTDWPNDTFLSARNLVRACDASLRRMQTDWIDLYQFHHVDLRTPWEEIWQACETLVAQGKVLYVGSSNHAGWQLAAAKEAAAQPALHRPGQRAVALQPAGPRHRARGDPGRGALRHRHHPVEPAAGRPAGRGAGQAGRAAGATQRARTRSGSRRSAPQLEKYEAAVPGRGATRPPTWDSPGCCTRPAVTAPIVGPRTMEQFEASLSAVDVTLDDEQLAAWTRSSPATGPPRRTTPGEAARALTSATGRSAGTGRPG